MPCKPAMQACHASLLFGLLEVMSPKGAVLMELSDVVFRKVLPEQIQTAIAAQLTTEDARSLELRCLQAACLMGWEDGAVAICLGTEDLRDRMAAGRASTSQRGAMANSWRPDSRDQCYAC